MPESAVIRVLRAGASQWLTFGGFIALFAGIVLHDQRPTLGHWTITLPLLLLAWNLLAALLIDRRFRGQPALFGFHVCLLALAVLAGWSWLGSFEGRVSLVDGQDYDPAAMAVIDRGPWARDLPAFGVFRQGGVEVDYRPDLVRAGTRSRIHVPGQGTLEIGDDVPARIDGYRFYTTSNKGFAALLYWRDGGAPAEYGVVQFPSYPVKQLVQTAAWKSPVGTRFEFSYDDPVVDRGVAWTLRQDLVDGATITAQVDGVAYQLARGQELRIGSEVLVFDGMRMWMGYRVRLIPGLSWLFAISVLAIVMLAVHFLRGALPVSQRIHDRMERAT